MNWFQFARLIHSIYGAQKTLPDLEWIENLGLLAVKLGQMHALRVDFLDPAKCQHLAKLYRRTNALAPDDFMELLEHTAPPGFSAAFESIQSKAYASASVGQVHKARLRDGSPVVIKAVKKDAGAQFKSDVQSLRRLMKLATGLYPPLKRVGDPVAILSDIEEYTLSELDLAHEVEGQETLRRLKECHQQRFDLDTLRLPRIYHDLCSENIMVSEFVEGRTVDELLDEGCFDYADLVELFRVQGYFIFCVGVFHGDLHPGNVIINGDKICFVDTGFIGCVGENIRRGLFHFFQGLSVFDYNVCALALNEMSEKKIVGEAFDHFHQKMLDLYVDFTDATVSQVSLTRQMMQTIKLGVLCGMHFEKGIFSVIRSLMYMDGMVLRCNPDAVLMRDIRPFLSEASNMV
jgi:ubiquinone biosynthesis protein